MAALARYGGELLLAPTAGGNTPETGTSKNGTIEVETAKARLGGRGCAKCPASASNYLNQSVRGLLDRSFFLRFAFRGSALPASTFALARIFDGTGTLLELSLSSTGKVE